LGIYVFRFFKYDRWVYVPVDNRLPVTKKGEMIFSHSRGDSDQDEFWVALAEKAYAKLYGCYHALNQGTVFEALYDLTSIPPQLFDINDDNKLWNFLYKKQDKEINHLSAVYIEGSFGEEIIIRD